MACYPCQQQGRAFVTSARAFDPYGMAQAVTRGVAINIDKMRGIDVNAKYGTSGTPIVKAPPYQRKDIERT
jgi:hypothetical protein